MLDEIRSLLDTTGSCVVTVVAPLDRRRPGNDQDRIRLRNLAHTAREQVRASADERVARAVIQRLDDALAGVDLEHPGNGVAVVAADEWARTFMLPFPVREAVVIGTTPFTRFLIQGLRRSPRYRVLVLAEKSTRLFDAMRSELHEVHAHGFPFANDAAGVDRRSVAGRFAREPAGDDREGTRRFYRDVDVALHAVTAEERLPLVYAGVERSVGLFEQVARRDLEVIGRIDGNYEHLTPHELGAAAWSIMRDHLRGSRAKVIAELREGVGTGRAVTGLDAVGTLAEQGRGRTLVVEEGFHVERAPSTEGHAGSPEGTRGPFVGDDLVDDVVEAVVRGGGNVEFVADDSIGDLGRIGLFTRR